MGGQQGSRGYLYQGIVSIFNACAEPDWNKISVEYTTPNDKVDIALMSDTGDILKAIQVKSSVNLFTKDNIVTWLTDIMNDVSAKEYQLILIGSCQEPANKLIKSVDKFCSNAPLDLETTQSLGVFSQKLIGKSVRVLLLPFDSNHLMGVIRDSLNRFISLQGYTIDFTALEQICYALITLYMFLGTNGKAICKADYEKRITEWLVSSANGGMKRKGNYSELELKVVQDDSLSNIGTSIPFSRIKTLLKYRDSVLATGASLIQQIQKIKLPAFEDCREVKRCDPDKIRKYIKGDLPDFDFGDFPKYKRSELSEDEKNRKKDAIRKYWSVSVEEDFFNVGNLSESNLLTSFTGQVDYNGLDIEKCKNSLIHELIGKILILKCIDRTTDILQNVHLVPLCIVNTSDVSDKDISVSLIVNNDSFRSFSLASEVKGDDKIMLNAMADTLIEEEILEIVLKIGATSNISLEPEKWSPAVPFVMPNPFGGRRMYDFDDLVIEWAKFQAEVATNGMVTYEFSTLRPGEAKWLSPYLMIVPTAESFSLEYIILSESSGSKKTGTVEIHVNN